MALDPQVKQFATGTNFAALTTLFEGGQPQTQVMWVDADDDHILINTETERQKFRNVERDPRVTVLVWNKENPYQYVEVRGKVVEVVHGDEARAHLDACAQRYTGNDYNADNIGSPRAILKIAPDRQLVRI